MNQAGGFQIRTMRREELAFAIDLAANEGWNPGLNDGACFFAADPEGFLIGELNGKPIGCLSAVSYAGRFGFIGLYIVRPEFRGQGYGIQLWHAAMTRLRGHNIGLDGVLAQQHNYARSGFQLAYRNIRYQGQARAGTVHPMVRPVAPSDFQVIRAYDRRVFPEPRDTFLQAWITQSGCETFIAHESGQILGYTVVRPCRQGWKIGPLAAEDAVVARRLYDAACLHAGPHATLFLDIPEINLAARGLAAFLGLTPVFETARMYTGPNPAVELDKLYGVTSFELG